MMISKTMILLVVQTLHRTNMIILFSWQNLLKKNSEQLNHGTIIRTGITCKKFRGYMRHSACRWLIVENAKIFRSYVNPFCANF